MKVHKLGNDYAFQKKQESEQAKLMNDEPKAHPVVEPEIKKESNVANKIQDRGKRIVENDSENDSIQGLQTETQETKKKEKKTCAEKDKLPEIS